LTAKYRKPRSFLPETGEILAASQPITHQGRPKLCRRIYHQYPFGRKLRVAIPPT